MLQDYYEAFAPTPTIFPRFRQLPPELRVKIWHDALPGPRTIHLVTKCVYLASSQSSSNSSVDEDMLSPYSIFENSASRMHGRRRRRPHTTTCNATVQCPIEITSLLHTCQESRHEVLSRYQPLHNPRTLDNPHFRIHYFDPSIDGIFVEDMWPWRPQGSMRPTGVFKSKHLSISCNSWLLKFFAKNAATLFGTKQGLLKFRNLEELHIVFRIATQEEKEKVWRHNARLRGGHVWSGAYSAYHMAPHVMTEFLRKPEAPYDIAFPDYGCMERIHVDDIIRKFEDIKKDHPDWKVPKVKLIQWATRPVKKQACSDWGDWSE